MSRFKSTIVRQPLLWIRFTPNGIMVINDGWMWLYLHVSSTHDFYPLQKGLKLGWPTNFSHTPRWNQTKHLQICVHFTVDPTIVCKGLSLWYVNWRMLYKIQPFFGLLIVPHGFRPQRLLDNVMPCTLETIPNHEIVRVLTWKEKWKKRKRKLEIKQNNVDSSWASWTFRTTWSRWWSMWVRAMWPRWLRYFTRPFKIQRTCTHINIIGFNLIN